jgi:ABC-type multidrug transport system fused ATPase/permease subunit
VAIDCGTFEWEVGEPIELGKGKGKGKGKGTAQGKDDGKGQGTCQGKAQGEGNLKEATANGEVKTQATFSLRDVAVAGEAGQLCVAVGKVGSGKSSLLQAILLEMPKRAGHVSLEGSVAYCAQQPWIQNATIRDNILFGSPMDEALYDQVIEMCALGPDCQTLPGGDLTEIGEKGVTLSGGQKARVALARACYREADVYLLDDVLSAVDSETGSWLFEHCIKVLLARKALVVLATNATHILQEADAIWVLKEGVVSEQGVFDDLRAQEGGDLNELLSLMATEREAQATPPKKEEQAAKGATQGDKEDTCDQKAPRHQVAKSEKIWTVASSSTRLSGNQKSGELTTKELRAEGSVSWQVWYFYFITCPGGPCIPLGVLLCALVGQASKNTFEWWLSYWSTMSTEHGSDSVDNHLMIYAILGAIACVFQFFRALVLAELILRNSKRLHELLLSGVMRAPMSFFDTTSMGRVMNRFSKDMDSMDTRLQQCMPTFIVLFTDIIGLCLTIGFNMPFFFLPLVPIVFFYWDVSRRFRPLNRDLQRLESTSRSPLFAQFSETLVGSSTIRAYKETQRFLDQSVECINTSNRAFFTIHNANRWLQLRLEFLGSLLLLSVICFALFGRDVGTVEPGVVALSMFYALNAAQVLNFAIRMLAETEARMTSAERIHEYAVKVVPEAPALTESNSRT